MAGVFTSRPEDLYQDPLLIVVPALFVITAALVTMRLFSLAMRLLDVLANHTPWLTVHLACANWDGRAMNTSVPCCW